MKIKELQKTVNIAWSPQAQEPIYIAAGTAAQQLDSNGSSFLEIYATNFTDPSYDLELKASVPCQLRFQKLIWSSTGIDGGHQNGLIVGGCEGGHIQVYSAEKMLANEDSLLARQDKHTGAVTGMDFNPFQNNLLASCASESEILIWDLNNTSKPMNPGTKTQPLEDVQNVAWNRQVQHILASVFSSRCVIWDLRKNEQIIKLSDTQSRVRWHAVQWHPDVATQVWLASEDDQAPVVQLWDLRYATAPAKTMQIHQRGVLGMSWCPQDIDVMVSCGKDNRIYCWNPNTELPEGEILSEVATTATWYSDVKFCPRNPALIASSSLDGNVSIYSLFGGTQQQVETANKIADSFPGMDQFAQAPMPQQSTHIVYHDLKKAPKFLKRPNGVSFGFGGKLVTFNGKSKSVNINQVISEPELVERANALEKSLQEENYIEYCRHRADQMSDQNGRYLWYFIKANFENDPKEEMLNLLGFNKEDIDGKFSKYVKEDEDLQNNVEHITNHMAHLTHSDSSEVECDHSTNGSIDSQPVDNNSVFDNIAVQQQLKAINEEKANVQFSIPKGEDSDGLITEALLTGNIEAAVELCLDSQRIAEALIIASTAGIDFLIKIQNRFLNKNETSLSNIISALVTRDWLDFVNRCTVDSWKEALVATLKHNSRKSEGICERLGDRLATEKSNSLDFLRNSLLCYICAGSIDKVVDVWYKIKQLENQNHNYKLNTVEIQELAEIVMLLSKALEHQGYALQLNDHFADFVKEYGGLLVSQGALTAALSYIMALGDGDHPEINDLKQRIHSTVNYRNGTQNPAQQTQLQNNQNNYGYNQQNQQNIYSRQNQSNNQQPSSQYVNPLIQHRGSFSQTQSVGGLQSPPSSVSQGAYQSNAWNPPVAAAPVPSTAPPLQSAISPLYNPLQAPGSAVKSPLIPTMQNDMAQPPRPASNASSQGGVGGGGGGNNSGGLHSRSKYVLDPSVAPLGGPASYGNIASPYSAPAPAPLTAPNTFNPSTFNSNSLQPHQSSSTPYMPSNFNTAPLINSNPYGGNMLDSMPQQTLNPPSRQNVQRNPTPPPGWNDPPALTSRKTNYYNENKEMSAEHAGTRKWNKIIYHIKDKDIDEISSSATIRTEFNSNFQNDYSFPQSSKTEGSVAPITHPLFGVDPNQNQNGYLDPNQYAQNAPPSGMQQQPSTMVGNYMNPSMSQNNNMMPPSAASVNANSQQFSAMNFQTSAISNSQHQQHQQQQQQIPNQWNSQTAVAYTEQPALIQRKPEPIKEKPPLPEEYVYLQTVLEELKNLCLNAANDPRTKRKFVDVAKRLENLYDCLRDGRLTPGTINSLNQIVQYLQIGDYANALQVHTQIAFGTDFSQCAGFMPGLKVLVQSASELQVYLR